MLVATSRSGVLAALILAALVGTGCTGARPVPAPTAPTAPTASPSPSEARVDTAHQHHHAGVPAVTIHAGSTYTEADVHFMQGMIAHHAQAIHMSRMAASRGASPRLTRLAQKIDLSQAGEIALMQDWLRANGQFAPEASSWRTMTMPGMLTPDELASLEAAREAEFDRLYLELMIRHHEGALKMVADLLASPRAAQDVDVSVLANDIETTQMAEIATMRQMLLEL